MSGEKKLKTVPHDDPRHRKMAEDLSALVQQAQELGLRYSFKVASQDRGPAFFSYKISGPAPKPRGES